MSECLEKTIAAAQTWRTRSDLPADCVAQAETLLRMAIRLVGEDQTDMVAEKSLKMIGCHLCRRIGEARCKTAEGGPFHCPLGFRHEECDGTDAAALAATSVQGRADADQPASVDEATRRRNSSSAQSSVENMFSAPMAWVSPVRSITS